MTKAGGLQGLSRRSFLKAAGAAGALGLAGGMTAASDWLAPAEAFAEPAEHGIYLCHQFHCLSGCSIKGTVRDDRVVLLEPNDKCDEKHRTICLRGIGEVQHIYSKERLQTPLKRVGERGEGKFEEISWEEAVKEIADAVKEAQEKYGENAFFCRKATEPWAAFDFITVVLHGDQGGNWGLDRGSANGTTGILGPSTYCPTRSIWEFKDASTIIEIGHNPLESGITWSRALMDAKEAGTYIVTVDPRFSGTASKSDEWLPIKPGTDSALVQGMIRVIVDNKWYDEDFIRANTSLSHLVNLATGEHYRSDEEACPAAHPVTGVTPGKPYVYDEKAQAPALYDAEGIVPALEGEYVIEGQRYATEFTLMKKWLAEYSLEWASSKCGIEESVIVALADRYANNGPAIIDFGLGGPDKYTNADVLGHSMAILSAITGNLGRKGSGLGFYGGVGSDEPAATLNAWPLPDTCYYSDCGMGMYDMPYNENNVHVALTYGDAFTLEAANANDMLKWVKSLDFFAIVDMYHSSIVDYADIVLPACTKFECEENVKDLRDSHGYVSLSNGMIKPLFNSKSDLQIERMICAEWGLDNLLPKTYEELARHKLDGVEKLSPSMEGITYEGLLANQGVAMIPGADNWYPESSADHIYGTPTTKIEVYQDYLLGQGHQFPVYEEANEAFEENPKKAEYPLYFTQGKSRYRIHAYYSACQWFQENYGPSVNISPEDAAARGIETGDDVRVWNDRGYFVATALVNPSMQPGVLFMAETTYTSHYKEGFLQNVTNSARNERCYAMYHGPQIPYNDTLVQVEKA